MGRRRMGNLSGRPKKLPLSSSHRFPLSQVRGASHATRRDHRVAGAHRGRRGAVRPRPPADLPPDAAGPAGARRHPDRRSRPTDRHGGQGVPRPHSHEPLGRRRRGALVRGGGLPHPAADDRQRHRPALPGRLADPGHRRLAAVGNVRRGDGHDDDPGHHRPDRHPAAEPPRRRGPQVRFAGSTPARRTSSRPSSSSSASAS